MFVNYLEAINVVSIATLEWEYFEMRLAMRSSIRIFDVKICDVNTVIYKNFVFFWTYLIYHLFTHKRYLRRKTCKTCSV